MIGIEIESDFSGLEDLKQRAKDIKDKKKISLDELFHPEFMRKNTKHSTIGDFLKEARYDVESGKELVEAIPEKFVRNNTRFSSWQEMFSEATKEWAQKQLGFD